MPNLYTIVARKESTQPELSVWETSSIIYHDIFDYPLTFSELIKWKGGEAAQISGLEYPISQKNGYYFIEGKEGLIYKRLLRKRISDKKLGIAKRAAALLSFLPGIKMVAVTGSLAMENAGEESDIDLMIIAKKRSLWTTRLIAYSLIRLFGIPTRRPNNKVEKDRLCLNMWLDESDLVWPEKDRNIYTAHEIAQIVPLVDKSETHKKFLSKNKWVLAFWPNAVKVRETKIKNEKQPPGLLEKICFRLQYQYMKPKITREVITPTRALFHPQDWGKIVLSRLHP